MLSVLSNRGEVALRWETLLRERILPYWFDTSVNQAGGYQLFDIASRAQPNSWLDSINSLLTKLTNKNASNGRELRGLVSQTRLLWVFSFAHNQGYTGRDYLKAAEHGYRYLIATMLDSERGGFYWKADVKQGITQSFKILYGQAFSIYGLVEYHRASGLAEPVDQALSVYTAVQQCRQRYDWVEHCDRDFKPLVPMQSRLPGVPGLIGLRSSDALLHWMEALTELYLATQDHLVRESLLEALGLLKKHFFSADATECCEYRGPQWEWIDDPGLRTLSHGHNLEFAWLMIHAERALALPLSWPIFDGLINHTLTCAFDYEQGGFYFRGLANQVASDTDKAWWVQAEGLIALADAQDRIDPERYARVLDLLLDWIFTHQAAGDGIWITSTDRRGKPKDLTKAGEWKAGYHEVRAIAKFIRTFEP